MMCQACSDGDCHLCGMQTWCECDCSGPDGIYLPDGYDLSEKPTGFPDSKRVTCPDCGPVVVEGDVFESGKPISGMCPGCGERLYFAEPK